MALQSVGRRGGIETVATAIVIKQVVIIIRINKHTYTSVAYSGGGGGGGGGGETA